MPFESKDQNAWAHTPAGTKALGGEKAVKEWEGATDYSKLPKKKKKVKGGNTELAPDSMKAQSLVDGPQSNKETKSAFVTRKRKSIGRI